MGMMRGKVRHTEKVEGHYYYHYNYHYYSITANMRVFRASRENEVDETAEKTKKIREQKK